MSTEERCHAKNAIWLCQNCAKLIDNDENRFPTVVLHKWKGNAEAEALSIIGKAVSSEGKSSDNLTAEEIDILCAAAVKGEIHLIKVDEFNPWVMIESEKMSDESDPAFSAMYIEALKSLVKRGLVEFQGGILYSLTGTGFKTARTLKEARTEYQEEGDDDCIYSSTSKLGADKHFPVEFMIDEGEGISYRIDSDYPVDVLIMNWDDYKDWRNLNDDNDTFFYAEHLDQCLIEDEFWPEVSLRYVLVVLNESDEKFRVSTHVVHLIGGE